MPRGRNAAVLTVTSLLLLGIGLGAARPGFVTLAVAGLLLVLWALLDVGLQARLDVQRVASQLVTTAGQPVSVRLRVRNRSRLLPARAIGADQVRHSTLTETPVEHPVAVPTLAPGAEALLDYQLPTTRRGRITLGPLSFRSTDPFGLLSRQLHVGQSLDIIVRPTVYPVEAPTGGSAKALDGDSPDQSPNGALAFHSLRDYVPGDDRRSVHWRSTARRGELVVRQAADVVRPQLTVLLDTRAHVHEGYAGRSTDGFDDAVDVVASVLSSCLDAGLPVQFVSSGPEGAVLSVGEPEQLGEALDDLARAALTAGEALTPSRLQIAPDAHLLVVTGPALEACDELTALSRRHRGTLLLALGGDGSRAGDLPVQHQPDARSALQAWAQWGRR